MRNDWRKLSRTSGDGVKRIIDEENRRCLVLSWLCTPLSLSGFQDAGEWIKFESSAGLFSVLMPVQPTEEKETKESPYGPYTSTSLHE